MGALKITLQARKERIEKRLKAHGIFGYEITFLPYLMFNDKEFATPSEVGCRIMILCAIVSTIEEPSKKHLVRQWLENENLWKYLGYYEREYFETDEIEDEQLNELSWQIEGAYILAWTLNLIKDKPSPCHPANENQMDEFFSKIPPLGVPIASFSNGLAYRSTEEIFQENIFYELTTSYFRDLLFNGKEDTTEINRDASFHRHKALNWVRRFADIVEWGRTDTST